MQKKEVLVIGSDIAGCAVALALAKIGVSVAIVPSHKKNSSLADELLFTQVGLFFEQLKNSEWKQSASQSCSPQAVEQITSKAEQVIKDLLGSTLQLQVNSENSIRTLLVDKLTMCPNVEWLTDYIVTELITLEHHSSRRSDAYKAPTCLGAFLYHAKSQVVESFFAKETILACGGSGGLFPYSTSNIDDSGQGLALAKRAGARFIDIEHFQLEPLCLFERDAPCIPLSTVILKKGAMILTSRKEPLKLSENIGEGLYKEMLISRSEHLWLDLSHFEESIFQEYPIFKTFCERYTLDPKKDLLPVVPAVRERGGISVDKVSQTSMHRLRAIGLAACAGINMEKRVNLLKVVESLVWGVACAEDIGSQIKKYLYHFADIREMSQFKEAVDESSIKQELSLIKEVLWRGVAYASDVQQLHRASRLLQDLECRFTAQYRNHPASFQLKNSLEAAICLANVMPASR